jgi:Ca2+-binding RTX toxin-like protein
MIFLLTNNINVLLVVNAQVQNSNDNNLVGVRVMSPIDGQRISVGKSITISGISTDNSVNDCQVSVIVNALKPYQPTTAKGSGGKNDYSKWNYILSPEYTTIRGGENKITSKLECISLPANITKWYSVNITGIKAAGSDKISGSMAGDEIDGDNHNNVILGLGGNDRIDGKIADDTIEGNTGNDTLTGGNGNDRVEGGIGDDNIRGNLKNDVLFGGNGKDILFGGDGNDSLTGGNGADDFDCGKGTDIIIDFNTTQDDVKSGNCEIF